LISSAVVVLSSMMITTGQLEAIACSSGCSCQFVSHQMNKRWLEIVLTITNSILMHPDGSTFSSSARVVFEARLHPKVPLATSKQQFYLD
jgi:hypothetical protein